MKRWGLNKVMVIYSAVMVAFILLLGAVGYGSLERVVTPFKAIAELNLKKIELIGDMRGQYRQLRIALLTLAVPGLAEEDSANVIAEFTTVEKKYLDSEDAYTEIPFAPGEKEVYQALNDIWDKDIELVHRAMNLYKTGNPADRARMLAVLREERKMAVPYREATLKLVAFQKDLSKQNLKLALDAEKTGFTLLLVLVALISLVATAVGVLVSRSVSRTFLGLAADLNASAQFVASASHQISETSQKVSAASTQQSASLQETSAATEQINAIVLRNSENAEKSCTEATACEAATANGLSDMQEVLVSMNGIHDGNEQLRAQVAKSNARIGEIAEVIAGIAQKTKVINDIVFQTKLLSFNASVEAARAGEDGKGFAVVAEEVGTLAASSGRAANEISAMLSESVKKVESIITETQSSFEVLMREGTARIERGTSLAERCRQSIASVMDQIRELSAKSGQIATASTEQAKGVREIAAAIRQLDEATQQNSGSASEGAAASVSLADQAEQLRNSVETLVVCVKGTKAA